MCRINPVQGAGYTHISAIQSVYEADVLTSSLSLLGNEMVTIISFV